MPTPYKTRKHYNQLVLEIYRAVWEETQQRMTSAHLTKEPVVQPSSTWGSNVRRQLGDLLSSGLLPAKWSTGHLSSLSPGFSSYTPTIAFVVAQRLVLRHWLLVFDEIQLLDVSSATLLADVLSWFWRMGGVIVGTSNKVPDDLYKNGVQKERLQPFVEALKIRSPVFTMKASRDWREVKAGSTSQPSWYTMNEESAFRHAVYHVMCGQPVLNRQLYVFGRSLRVPKSSQDACQFSFSELCDEALGPADYLSIASSFRTLVLTDIPILPTSAKDKARRFILLIDALYEARCRLICLAQDKLEDLFFPDARVADGSDAVSTQQHEDVMMAEAVSEMHGRYRPNVSLYGVSKIGEAPPTSMPPLALHNLSIFSGKDEQFAFKCALSRLHEMTSEEYTREETWSPLKTQERKWEDTTHGAPAVPHALKQALADQPNRSGYRVAAVQQTEGGLRERTQPPATKLSDSHVWGMRDDWGPGAGKWGKGARAFDESTKNGA